MYLLIQAIAVGSTAYGYYKEDKFKKIENERRNNQMS